MKAILGVEAGIVVTVVLVLWLTAAPADLPPGVDNPVAMTVENGAVVHRPLETPRSIMAPPVLGAGTFLAVAVPLAMRDRGRRGEG